MQDPNEDTEWNSILRSKGILPPKEKELTEEEVVKVVESVVQEKQSKGGKLLGQLDLDELDELEDEEDEKIILEYRQKRIAEIKAAATKPQFGDVREISAVDYIDHVNKAGEGVWVVLHLYKPGIPLCTLINQHLSQLAVKFPATKFLRSVSTTCIPNFPDSNLPSLFIYYEGDLRKQLVGPLVFRGMNLKLDELEWIIGEAGAIPTKLKEDPRPKVEDVLFSRLKPDENDWSLAKYAILVYGMQAGVVQVPVFVYPTPIVFYLDDQNTHKQVLTLYNPYEFPIRFRVLCTAPNKYSVVDPEGSIRPRCCIDIVIRHNAVSLANCSITDKFRIQMQNHTTKQLIGKQDIAATLLPGKPSGPISEHEEFKRLSPRADTTTVSNVQQQFSLGRDPRQGRLQTPNYTVIVTAVVCIIALLLPTQGDEDTRFPAYLHLTSHLKLAFAYVLGLVTMVILRSS